MQKTTPEIVCPVFLRQESRIGMLTDRINRSNSIGLKAKFAEEMDKDAKLLLRCPDYDERSPDCVNCYTVSILREKMVLLILRMSRTFL